MGVISERPRQRVVAKGTGLTLGELDAFEGDRNARIFRGELKWVFIKPDVKLRVVRRWTKGKRMCLRR